MKNQMKEAAEAYGHALEEPTSKRVDITQPDRLQRRVMWMYNEIGKLAHADSIAKCIQIFEYILHSKFMCFYMI